MSRSSVVNTYRSASSSVFTDFTDLWHIVA
jgi:hypothetical protein